MKSSDKKRPTKKPDKADAKSAGKETGESKPRQPKKSKVTKPAAKPEPVNKEPKPGKSRQPKKSKVTKPAAKPEPVNKEPKPGKPRQPKKAKAVKPTAKVEPVNKEPKPGKPRQPKKAQATKPVAKKEQVNKEPKPGKPRQPKKAKAAKPTAKVEPVIKGLPKVKSGFKKNSQPDAGKQSFVGGEKKKDKSKSKNKDQAPKKEKRSISIVRNPLNKKERLDPYLTGFYKTIENYIQEELFLLEESVIVIAVSGGVDSVALLDVLCVLAEKYKFELHIAHYNHTLRGASSDKDEAFVKSLAKKYGIEFHHSRGKVKQFAKRRSLSTEHAARVLRYMFLERTARTQKSSIIATAHTSDDSAETFLLNLLRGSGLTGLSGIAPRRQLGKNVTLYRPFLCLTKARIIEYARKRKLKWREDESNALLNYTRNKVRLSLLPKLAEDFSPAISEIINRTARLIQGADEFIEDYVRVVSEDLVYNKTSGSFSFRIPLLQTFSEFIQGEIFQFVLFKHFQMLPLSINMVDRLLSLQFSPVGSVCELPGNVMVLKDRDVLIFSRKMEELDCDEVIEQVGEFEVCNRKLILTKVARRGLKFTDNPNIEYFDLDLLPLLLHIRNWEHGDSFQPLGFNGTVKISDYLINVKAPMIEKKKVLVLTAGSEIVWVCGYRADDKFKVTSTTTKVLKAEFK